MSGMKDGWRGGAWREGRLAGRAVDGRTFARTYGWLYVLVEGHVWTNGRVDERKDGRVNGLSLRRTDAWMYVGMDEPAIRWTGVCTERQVAVTWVEGRAGGETV
jgi:hypothetical protein